MIPNIFPCSIISKNKVFISDNTEVIGLYRKIISGKPYISQTLVTLTLNIAWEKWSGDEAEYSKHWKQTTLAVRTSHSMDSEEVRLIDQESVGTRERWTKHSNMIPGTDGLQSAPRQRWRSLPSPPAGSPGTRSLTEDSSSTWHAWLHQLYRCRSWMWLH